MQSNCFENFVVWRSEKKIRSFRNTEGETDKRNMERNEFYEIQATDGVFGTSWKDYEARYSCTNSELNIKPR